MTIKALRYYERVGLLQPARLPSGYRDYSEQDVRFASEIRTLISLGLTSEATRPFLECLRSGHDLGDDCPEALAAYQARIDRLDALIDALTRTRAELAAQLRDAAARGFGSSMPAHDVSGSTGLPRPDPLPRNLPPPIDDGAARHLPGRRLPGLTFQTSDGERIALNSVSDGCWVLFIYPLTGDPAVDMPRGWDQIPGARGCSQEACGFRDNLPALACLGVERVIALSSDHAEYQRHLIRRLQLPYAMVSDPDLTLGQALGLPTFDVAGRRLYKRLTLLLDADRIMHVFYPVFPPDSHAEEVVEWLRIHPRPSS